MILRVLRGEVPWTFTIEVVLRMAIIYVVLLVALRLMGKRMASQATRNELAALVAVAGGIGPAVQDPANGLLPAIIVAAVIAGGQRLVAALGMNHARFERMTQGERTLLVRRGAMDMDALRAIALSRDRVRAQLRGTEIVNLGAVERMYLEIDGAFTTVKASPPQPGLSLIPTGDEELRRAQRKAPDFVCSVCGRLIADDCECICGARSCEHAVCP